MLALSDILQYKGLDLGKDCTLVVATIKQLEQIKTEEVFHKMYCEVTDFARKTR